ncbi:amino acid permease [Scopulibacillus cellulosilyticus]|uniref:Amino acid permease n=1 Tax=Scopulibacillus cellulosilyticus TaxID=2665665 RepID=A0ABW2PVL4_9BACL
MSKNRTGRQVSDERHELKQSLRNRHVTMIALGGIIGAGLFVGSGAVINATGPAAILSYLLAGGLMILVMRMIGEMAVAYPSTGSISDYSRKALGNWAGFTVGWLYWYFWLIVLAIEAVAGAGILVNYLNIPPWLLCLLLILLLTLTNLYSVNSYGEAEFWLASIKVIAIIAFIAVGVLYLIGLWHGHSPGFSNLYSKGGFFPKGIGAAFIGSVTVLFSIGGAEIATIAAAESNNPAKNAATATKQVMYRVFFFYVVSVFIIVAIVPWNVKFGGVAIQSPFAIALNHLGIPVAGTIMQFVILTAVLSSLNSCIYITSRMLFALTKQGDAPRIFFKTTKRGVPVWAILAGTLFGYVGVILDYFFPNTVFLFLINSAGAVSLFYYLIIAYSEIKLRRKLEREAPEKLKLKMWCFPYLTYFSISCMLAVLIVMLFLQDTRSEVLMSFISFIVILLAYAIHAKRKKRLGQYIDKPVSGQFEN